MSEEDNIFREVDEDMRREQLAAMWDKYGIFVLIGAGLIVAIVGGYNFYNWWQDQRAAESGEAYYEASQAFTTDKGKALEELSKLVQSSGAGYGTLANLKMAAIQADEGKKAEAVALYDKVAQSGADELLRDYAKLQAASLRIDEADRSEIEKRLEGLNTVTNPWRYSAKELLALAAFRSGNAGESEKLYNEILSDPSAPANIRRRAESMLALLVKAEKQVSSAASGDAASQTQ